jgi:hypothetical protein
MSSLRFEPAPGPARFSCSPLGSGQAGDWIGRWANGRSATIVVNIACPDSARREYDIAVRERLASTPAALLRHTFVQIFESQSLTSQFPHLTDDQVAHGRTPAQEVRTLLLPEHGILLGLYQLVDQQAGQQSRPYSRIIRYRRPATARAAAVDLMLRPTPRVS